MSIDAARERRVLALRSEGRSFGSIARELDLEDPASAYAAFQQALSNTPQPRRSVLQLQELDRLDRLAASLREQQGAQPKAAGQLAAVERLRGLQLGEWLDRAAEWADGPEPSG